MGVGVSTQNIYPRRVELLLLLWYIFTLQKLPLDATTLEINEFGGSRAQPPRTVEPHLAIPPHHSSKGVAATSKVTFRATTPSTLLSGLGLV